MLNSAVSHFLLAMASADMRGKVRCDYLILFLHRSFRPCGDIQHLPQSRLAPLLSQTHHTNRHLHTIIEE